MRNHLKDMRRARGLSQQDLAGLAGVSRQTVIAIEKGRYDPSLPLAFELARVFGVRIEDVFVPETGSDTGERIQGKRRDRPARDKGVSGGLGP